MYDVQKSVNCKIDDKIDKVDSNQLLKIMLSLSNCRFYHFIDIKKGRPGCPILKTQGVLNIGHLDMVLLFLINN